MRSSYSSYSNQALFAALPKGDEEVFTELFKRYDTRIHRFVLKMVKLESEAEELTQDIFVHLWDQRLKLDGVENGEGFLITMAAHRVYNYVRKSLNEEKMRARLAQVMLEQASESADGLALLHGSENLVKQAIDKLPEQQKKVFLASFYEGLNYGEIAQKLKISPNTVRNHLVAANRSIRLYINEQGAVSILLAIGLDLFIQK